MNRHLLVGRLGVDTVPIAAGHNEAVTEVRLLTPTRRLCYGVEQAMIELNRLHVHPSEIGLDLAFIAAMIYAADTRISGRRSPENFWTREIRLNVPVSAPDRWTRARGILIKLLDFLTGDRWSIDFRDRPEASKALSPPAPARLLGPPFDTVALFSGGLDSLIGAIDALEAGGRPLLVSHAGEGAVSKSQDDCFDLLKAKYPDRSLERLRVWMSFPKGFIDGVGSENTTRGRSFLFFALGAFAGTGLDGPFTLNVPENGLIALNVPLDPLRLGALSTRTTHPYYIARWNELLSAVGISGTIVNPYWNRTKGENGRHLCRPGTPPGCGAQVFFVFFAHERTLERQADRALRLLPTLSDSTGVPSQGLGSGRRSDGIRPVRPVGQGTGHASGRGPTGPIFPIGRSPTECPSGPGQTPDP